MDLEGWSFEFMLEGKILEGRNVHGGFHSTLRQENEQRHRPKLFWAEEVVGKSIEKRAWKGG